MSQLPPPPAVPPSPPPVPPPPADRPHLAASTPPARISRRRLLVAAAGSMVVTTGVTALVRRQAGSAGSAAPGSSTPPGTAMPAATLPATTLPATTLPATTLPATTEPALTPPDRVLVVVQLSGGNDALNTLVPLRGRYHDLRPSIALADDTLLTVPGTAGYGFNPALAPMQPLVDAGLVGVVAGIGFDRPDRSHFAALDMWWSATPGSASGTGWLGRWLDATSAPDDVVLRATGFGGAVPALRATNARAVGINELSQFALPAVDADVLAAWASLTPEHAVAASATEAIAGLDLSWVGDLGGDGDELVADAAGDGAVARLAAAAELIVSQPGVRVVHVSLGGYDTHAGQLDVHARLLDELATAIAVFQRRVDEAGWADRVLLVTTSEFGRRVQENGSGGTDHGKAGVLFVVGAGVSTAAGSVHGSIDPDDTVDGDLRPVVDPRSLYATALDWLGPDRSLTDAVLGGSFERLPFVV